MTTMKTRLYGALFAGIAVFAAIILSACTFALDPVNAITDAFRFADTNVGTLKVANGAQNGAVLYGVQVIMPDKSLSEYHFETGLLPGSSREYRLPAQINYSVKFGNGKGWSKNPQSVYFAKDETFTVTFTGTEEISIDLSGVKGKLTVYNQIPADKGEYVIENIRVSSTEGENSNDREDIVFYFYTAGGIHPGEKPDFDVLPGNYWVRAQIRNPDGKLSKWSIPAHVGSYSTEKASDEPGVSVAPGKVTVNANAGGIAIFNEKVLEGGAAGGKVVIETPEHPSIPDNSVLDDNGNEIPNVEGKVDPDSDPVKSIKVEKLGFPTADKNGITGSPTYTYTQKNEAVQEGKTVKTTIYDQAVAAGREWHLALTEEGWYLLSFSTDGKTFSKAFPIRVSKGSNGNLVVEPEDIPPFNDDDSTWTEKNGVIVSNDTPAGGGEITYPDGSKGALSVADAKKPITDIKVYNPDGSLYGHYRNLYGLPVYNGKEWIISPALPAGDYLVSLSDDNGSTWTYPPYPFQVDGNGDAEINYDKTHPFWNGKTTGKPGPELTSPADPKWDDPNDPSDSNWKPGTEIDPKTPVYVVVPAEPPLDEVPPGANTVKELADVDTPPEDTQSAPYSQLDIVHLTSSDLNKINYIRLNSFSTPGRVYRIIDLTRITYTGGTGGIPKGKRLSLAGFDFTPGLYYVYLSQNGKIWSKYKASVNIPVPWTIQDGKPVQAGEVEKVIYKDSNDNWVLNTDSDGDGFLDDWEEQYGYDPNDPSDPVPGGDDDEDGLTNQEEYNKGTDPTNPDTDGDGYNDKEDPDPLDKTVPGDRGSPDPTPPVIILPDRGFLAVQNLTASTAITSLTIKNSRGALVYDGKTYNNLSVNIAPDPVNYSFDLYYIPVTSVSPSTANPYTVILRGGSYTRTYSVTIWHNRQTYVKFRDTSPSGDESTPNPGNSKQKDTDSGTPPPDSDGDDLTVIDGGSGTWGPMQPGEDPVGTWNTSENSGNLFDRNYSTMGSRLYWSGQVQPYFPNPSVSVQYPSGGDGTKQNIGRGYFNFRFFWTADTNWGIGYLAIRKLQRSGTSSTRTPVGDTIVLLDAKASNEADRKSGAGQSALGQIAGDVKGESKSFNQWRANWLGLRDSDTGWQMNVSGSALDPRQPVYRSGKGYYPTDPDTAWNNKSNKNDAVHREYGAHRALNNPGRLYTTGVKSSGGLYADLGAGFEAGEYRVYLYKGYDSLYKTYTDSTYNDAARQKKMYRYYEDSFDIVIYPGVVTTAIYRATVETGDIKGAFAYTPIPQAAFGKLVVLNNPPTKDYTITAILLDKPGYYNTVNTSAVGEVHRYIAALSTGSSMTGGTPNLHNGNSWGRMNPLLTTRTHTFILPPGGYRIAVQSTKDRDQVRNWYGEGLNTWLPVVVTEGETVYVTYTGSEVSR
jgi:hypothetical protein